jgi:hypothetical protein
LLELPLMRQVQAFQVSQPVAINIQALRLGQVLGVRLKQIHYFATWLTLD